MIDLSDLAQIVKLAKTCDGPQRRYGVADFRRTLVPAMELGQYQVVPDQWYAAWAFFSPDQVHQFMCMQEIDRPWSDREGTVLWLLDLVTHPSVDRASLIPHLMRAEWMKRTKHECMYFARTYGTGRFQRVGRLPRRYDDALASAH